MWFCVACMPKIKETIKIEKDIEKRCNEHYKKFEKICSDLETKFENKITDVEQKVNTKCSKQEVEKIVSDKLETFEVKNDKDEMEKMVQNTVTDMVDTKIVNKIAESERELADRQSRQKNVIIFKAKESNTNLIDERTKSDKELISKIVDGMNLDTEQINIEKAVRLGRRKDDPQENPRPLVITFSTLTAKKEFLKNANKLKQSDDASLNVMTIQNDMSQKDREHERELVLEKFSKNAEAAGNCRYVIRGPPGERKLIKIRTD